MKRTIRLTESELHGLIRECIEEVIYESKQPLTEAFQSQKLSQLVQQGGGINQSALGSDKYLLRSLNNLKDQDVIGLVSAKDNARKVANQYVNKLNKDVSILRLNDGTAVLVTPSEASQAGKNISYNRPGQYSGKGSLGDDSVDSHFENPYSNRIMYGKKYGDRNRDVFVSGDKDFDDVPQSDYNKYMSQKVGYPYKTVSNGLFNATMLGKARQWHDQKMAQGPNPAFK